MEPRFGATVIVSTYNRPRALDLVLAGLARQAVLPNAVIVADDGSGKETESVIKRWAQQGLPMVHCWQEDIGFRKSMVINQALQKVDTPYCIFLDGDCFPFPGFIRDHMQHAETGYVLAGSRVLANPALTQAIEAGVEPVADHSAYYWLGKRLRRQINRFAPFIRLPAGPWQKLWPSKWELVRGCNFSVETDALMRVDGFEERINGWGLEDSDVAIRLLNLGLKVKSLRFAAPVLHLWHPEQSRSNLAQNQAYLRDAQQTGRIKAIQGMSSHLSAA